MFAIKAWVDGSCWNKTGQGGWCAIVAAMRDDVTEEEVANIVHLASKALSPTQTVINSTEGDLLRTRVSILRGYATGTTNNRMEMQAIIEAVKAMKSRCAMHIVSDSTFAIGAFTEWNVKANLDLVDEWRRVSRGFKVMFEHVDGHNGNVLNEWADRIASYKNNPNLG